MIYLKIEFIVNEYINIMKRNIDDDVFSFFKSLIISVIFTKCYQKKISRQLKKKNCLFF